MGRSSATLQAAPRHAKVDTRPQADEGHRDTVEAIVVAFILALVVRGFEAQAFVIPTGSMAPTLMGPAQGSRLSAVRVRVCRQCIARSRASVGRPDVSTRGSASTAGIRPCSLNDSPSFKGDRILVMMFPYDLPFLPGSGPPERWDVVVFRYPEEPEVSYIKRLVGLPGRDHPDLSRRRVRQECRKRQVPAAASRCGIRSRPRSSSTTTAIDRRRSCGKTEWQRWQSTVPGWKVVDAAIAAVTSQTGGRADDVGRAAVSQSRARSRAMGGDCRSTGRCRGSRAPR